MKQILKKAIFTLAITATAACTVANAATFSQQAPAADSIVKSVQGNWPIGATVRGQGRIARAGATPQITITNILWLNNGDHVLVLQHPKVTGKDTFPDYYIEYAPNEEIADVLSAMAQEQHNKILEKSPVVGAVRGTPDKMEDRILFDEAAMPQDFLILSKAPATK